MKPLSLNVRNRTDLQMQPPQISSKFTKLNNDKTLKKCHSPSAFDKTHLPEGYGLVTTPHLPEIRLIVEPAKFI